MTKVKEQKKFTNRPAPMLPGLYSVQAIPSDMRCPDVTIYRRDASDAVAWKSLMVKREGGYSRFLLRHAVDAWEVYGADGLLECKCDNVTGTAEDELRKVVAVDREEVELEAGAVLGPGLTCISCVEGHAGASSAEHSNFCVLNRKMLVEATTEDLKHVFLVESRAWPCRVMSLMVAMDRVSTEFQNKFLDRHYWWSRGWPLDNSHHQTILASRLADVRRDYLGSVFVDALVESGTVGTSEAALSAKVGIALVPPDVRRTLAHKLIELSYKHLQYHGRGAEEKFDEVELRNNAALIAQIFVEVMG